MLSETVVSSKFQTAVPSKVRKNYDIEPGDVLEWEVVDDMIIIKVRKRVGIEDIKGMISIGGNAVDAKKAVQQGRGRA